MIRRLRKWLRGHSERLLAAVLLPAFFLGTLPQTACICADGHREAACPAMARGKARSGSATCCPSREQTRSCCQAKSCCGSRPASTTGIVARTTSCCHPVVESPAPAVTAKKTDAPAPSKIAATIDPISSLVPLVDVRPALVAANYATPPPLDAVIVYLHLTI